MADLFHECGIAAVYHLPISGQTSGSGVSRLVPPLIQAEMRGGDRNRTPEPPRADIRATAQLIPRILLEIQNRGQLAAGMSSFDPDNQHLVRTHKNVGTVNDVFRFQRKEQFAEVMSGLAGTAAIGHVRYATCGKDDPSYAQPFERQHIEKSKWFSFGFNGQLANYLDLREEILQQADFHLSRETDTEILMHLLSQQLAGNQKPTIEELLTRLARRLDGAYSIVYLNALGDMFVARDPLGLRPLCYAVQDGLFAAASESVALANVGFSDSSIHDLPPGHAVIIQNGQIRVQRFAESRGTAHCFFEWIYFANVASTLDDRSVYMVRKRLGEELAANEPLEKDDDLIVVPVPDTAKAAADAMAYRLGVPCVEGLIRNRYVGRTFIEGSDRADKVRMKFTPLREVLENKRVLLVEDTIVRSTTMQTLVSQIYSRGGAKEVHVRVACPPIVAPCFYGIDMSTVKELFAPRFLKGQPLSPATEAQMADAIGASSLRYLPEDSIARAMQMLPNQLCQACINGDYPTEAGQRLYQLALNDSSNGTAGIGRTYDVAVVGARL